LSSVIHFGSWRQPWQLAVCIGVLAYLALGVMTDSIRGYHWLMLAAIPAALLSAERGKRFFLDWSPLFAFWLVYDRLRLVQPLLYARVAVEHPFKIERGAFGWLTGAVPAHAAHSWLTLHAGRFASAVEWTAQIVYFSHLLVAPLLILALWRLGVSRKRYRAAFTQHVRAFTLLNFSAIIIYLLLPVAPPWWVSLNGFSQPTRELVGQVNMAAAMNGVLIQRMISNASQWFAAVPSLHGGYPVLLLLLSPWRRSRLARITIAVYGVAMWTATVVLNQHYVVDLLAGAMVAAAAWWLARSPLFERVYTLGIDQRVTRE
jgi:hypothetical protein